MSSLAHVSLLIIDDDPTIREVLKAWFALFGCEADEAADGFEAIRLVRNRAYDVIITDLQMPGLDGHQLLALFKDLVPDAEVIFLTGRGTMDDAIRALRGGRAYDFLQKPVRDFHQLNQVVEQAMARRQAHFARRPVQAPPPEVGPLTARELEIVGLLAEGLDNGEIADRLCLSEKTIKNHLTRIYEKLNVSNRTQAVVSAQTYGFIKGWAPDDGV